MQKLACRPVPMRREPLIEVHLISYKGDLYGREIDVQFIKYMRNVFKFDTVEELTEQIQKDRDEAKKALQL